MAESELEKLVAEEAEEVDEEVEEDVGEGKRRRDIPPDEMATLLSGPAIYSNKIYVSLSTVGIRITFAEQQEGGPPHYRTAAFLSYPDAIALKDLLIRQLSNVQVIAGERPESPEDGKDS